MNFKKLFQGIVPGGDNTVSRFRVEGMTCEGCAARVRKSLSSTAGVASVEVDLQGGQVTVAYDPTKTSADQLQAQIITTGYMAAPLSG